MLPQLRSSRRLLPLAACLSCAACLLYVGSRVLAFLHMFGVLQDHSGVQISQPEIAIAHNRTSPDPRMPVVPKITHQIYHEWKMPGNYTLPSHWERARKSCVDLNPGWDHKIWHLDNSREFLVEHFPWYIPTYDAYKFPIQRVDVMRYFLILHYGGIYLDLDNGCAANLDPLLYYPAFTTYGGHGALSNNIMGGQQGHPYFKLLVDNLIPYNWNYILPYIVVSWCSGQWFVTAMWEKYHSLLHPDGIVPGYSGAAWRPLHHVLMDMREGADPWVFFTQTTGGTWSNWDSGFFPWLGDHVFQVTAGIWGLVALLIWVCISCNRRFRRGRRRVGGKSGDEYRPIRSGEGSGSGSFGMEERSER